MTRSPLRTRLVAGVITGAMLLGLSGCGGGSDEVANLYIFNAYPGSNSLSLFGPNGTIVTGLPFGERSPQPISVDRNLGTDFTLLIDGAPVPFEMSEDLFALYPHETATFFVKKRSEAEAAEVFSFRHIQTASSECRVVFANALSLRNRDVGAFDYLTAWEVTPDAAGYASDDPRRTDPSTSALFDAIDQDPYFFPVDADSGLPDDYKFVWAGGRFNNESIEAPRPTEEYLECLGDEPDDAQVEECQKPMIYNGHLIRVDESEIRWYSFGPNGDGDCNLTFRLHSDFTNIFSFDENGKKIRVKDTVTFDPGQHHFWVLYGRPVSPKVENWSAGDASSGGGYVNLPDYPTKN